MANYKIIGADGVERGPVPLEQVRIWIAEQRLRAESKVRLEGTPEWVALGSLPEFGGALKIVPPPVFGNPPRLPGNPSPSPVSPLSLPVNPPPPPVEKKKTSMMAVLSLVFSLLGVAACLTSPVGMVLGIIAMVKISKSKGALGGFGFALAGIIIGSIGSLLAPAILLPALGAAKYRAEAITCANHERELMFEVRTYEVTHQQFPPATTWCEAIANGRPAILKCPSANTNKLCDFAFNSKLDGIDARKIAPDTVVFFESDEGWDAHGGSELLVSKPRHQTYNFAFADGHVESVPPARVRSLRWDP